MHRSQQLTDVRKDILIATFVSPPAWSNSKQHCQHPLVLLLGSFCCMSRAFSCTYSDAVRFAEHMDKMKPMSNSEEYQFTVLSAVNYGTNSLLCLLLLCG